MRLTFDWFLPTSGDGRTIYGRGHSLPIAQAQAADRPPDLEYLGQVARAAEQLGFAAVLTPTGTWCEDAWLATAALITATSRLKFLVAFRPGLISPTLAAQMAASYQRISRGRLLLNVVTGGRPRSSAGSATTCRTTSGTPGPASSWPSCGAPGPGSRSTSTAGTTRSSRPP